MLRKLPVLLLPLVLACPSISQAEIWLEIRTSSIEQAARYLKDCKIVRRDEIERLQGDLKGFWITSPSDIIHLINE